MPKIDAKLVKPDGTLFVASYGHREPRTALLALIDAVAAWAECDADEVEHCEDDDTLRFGGEVVGTFSWWVRSAAPVAAVPALARAA